MRDYALPENALNLCNMMERASRTAAFLTLNLARCRPARPGSPGQREIAFLIRGCATCNPFTLPGVLLLETSSHRAGCRHMAQAAVPQAPLTERMRRRWGI